MFKHISNKIIRKFEKELELYIRAYIDVSGHFNGSSEEEKQAVSWECYEMISDYSETRVCFEAWATLMFFDIDKYSDTITAIDDDSLSTNSYQKYMNFEYIDNIILELLEE